MRVYDGLATAASAETRSRRGRAPFRFMSSPVLGAFVIIARGTQIVTGAVIGRSARAIYRGSWDVAPVSIMGQQPLCPARAARAAIAVPGSDHRSRVSRPPRRRRRRSGLAARDFHPPQNRKLPASRGQLGDIGSATAPRACVKPMSAAITGSSGCSGLAADANRADATGHDHAFDAVIQPGADAQRVDRQSPTRRWSARRQRTRPRPAPPSPPGRRRWQHAARVCSGRVMVARRLPGPPGRPRGSAASPA